MASFTFRATLLSGFSPSIPTEHEGGWKLQPVWALWKKREISSVCRESSGRWPWLSYASPIHLTNAQYFSFYLTDQSSNAAQYKSPVYPKNLTEQKTFCGQDAEFQRQRKPSIQSPRCLTSLIWDWVELQCFSKKNGGPYNRLGRTQKTRIFKHTYRRTIGGVLHAVTFQSTYSESSSMQNPKRG